MTTSPTSDRSWLRRRKETPSAKPVEQQRLILDELARQIDVINAKQSAIVDRAAIVVAGDVVVSVLVVTQQGLGWLAIPILLSVVSAVFALIGIRLWKSTGSRLNKSTIDTLLTSPPYSVGYGFIRDRLAELDAAVRDLERKQRYIKPATWWLISAWAAALAVGVLQHLHLV
ncbi:hypothetical protein G3T36_18495 [Diaminobutyricibacter tongyongensis]|uniref:Uncharacterized protein n=1 Tax=Leifsonia tongyongensis TaxID=1268043 RepID=A0A6L9Y2F3_9MICO|nr:hypothetical protein [Diaminobutyricibacter tongyongensis]NEN07850.1 hypothetical protein [Diaminobutyricibacter tongyongensis]